MRSLQCGCMSEFIGPSVRGKLPIRWEKRVEEYVWEMPVSKRGRVDQAGRECCNKRWRLFCHGHPPGGQFFDGTRHQSYR